ncbi:MAG: A24 family peptidase C-terminal domain-containing protein [Candidatus Bathyarchaeia archaeon]
MRLRIMDLFSFRLLLSFGILTPSTVLDVKFREVQDEFWIIGSIIGTAINIIDVLTGQLELLRLLISLTVGCIMGFLLFYIGFFGGADSKALIFLSLTLPESPTWIQQFGVSLNIPVVTVFNNAIALSLCYPLAIAVLNTKELIMGRDPLRGIYVKGRLRRTLLFLTVKRVSFEELKKKVGYYPAEQPLEEDGRILRQPVYFMKAETDKEELLQKLEPYASKGLYRDGILVSPTIPFITFITLGLASLPVGDFILTFASLIR